MAKLPLDPGVMERMVVDIAAASLKNARALLTSAQAVLDAQQWPTSFSFAALALEEVGKASLCMTMLAMPPAVREEFRPDFEKMFTSHQTKAEFAHLILGLIDEKVPASVQQMLDDVVTAARRTNDVKFRGLYVDYTSTGDLLQPDTVGESDARLMVTAVTAALAASSFAESAVAEPDVFLDFLHQWQSAMDFDALGTHIAATPEDELLTQLRTVAQEDALAPSLFQGTVFADLVTAADTVVLTPAGRNAQTSTEHDRTPLEDRPFDTAAP
ncbi:AbiV family abortive infection protein [Streptomyces hokutonensis]|uniref:AbiV family abortive infection protein n=1 Tax=Streptomyces hokutonensis TaxID=1306990 RepID=UPI000372CCF0|nr:AbiV family abortive infection protein [Streptomyces hokutonensis]